MPKTRVKSHTRKRKGKRTRVRAHMRNYRGGFPLATQPTGRPKLSARRISEMDKMMDELLSAEKELDAARSRGDTEAIESLGVFTKGIKMRLAEPEKDEGFSFGAHPQTGKYEPGRMMEDIFFERTKRQKVKNG